MGRSGRTRASRGDTRTLSLQADQPIPWRSRGMGGPASARDPPRRPSTPAYSHQSPPLAKHEVSAHPHGYRAKRGTRVTDDSTPGSGAQEDLLGRARGDGWDAAGGPVPRAETRVPCLFKKTSLTRGEHVAWEDPRPRGTRLVAPRPPAYSPQAPPLAKHEVSAHPHEYSAKRKTRVTDDSTRVV